MAVATPEECHILSSYRESLLLEEKSPITVQKYKHDVTAFLEYSQSRPLTKELVMEWKQALQDEGCALRTVNSMLESLNSWLRFLHREDCCTK